MTLARLRAALLAEGGSVAAAVAGAPDVAAAGADDDEAPEAMLGPAQLAAAGPRAAGREDEYELLLEIILEGSLLHYEAPRVVAVEDPDLALLLGDQLYALGLSRLAALGDLDAVAELGDVISLVAQARASGDSELADAIWRAGAAAIGWGASPDHQAAKERARGRDPGAAAALQRACDAVLAHAEPAGK